MEGKIIAVTGGPRTGKSTLVKLLAECLGGQAFLEGEESDFPPRVLEDIGQGIRSFELIIWFRNRAIKTYLEAVELKKNNGIAILDTFWLTNDIYIDEWITDPFEKEILKSVMSLDTRLLPWPDMIISLYANEEKIKEFAVAGGREFELSDEFLRKQIALNDAHQKYFNDLPIKNGLFIDRSDFDYFNAKHLEDLLAQIKQRLK